jgi:LysM repeat protein
LWLPLLGLFPLVAAVLASEWAPFRGGSGSPLSAARPGPTIVVVVSATSALPPAPTLQSIPAPPQATSAPTPIGSVAAAAPTRTAAQTAAAPAAAAAGVSPTSAPVASGTRSATGPFTAYRVQPGDTIRSIASMYGVTPASVSQASGLQNPDRLQVGQVLTIPNQSGYLYRVQPGETLDQIAARTGISSATIATVSKLQMASVRAGDVLLIPDQSAAKNK